MTAVSQPMAARTLAPVRSIVRDNAWALGLVGFLVLVLVFTKLIQPSYGVTGIQGLAVSVLPLALASVAQAIVVISGGIDLDRIDDGAHERRRRVADEGPERGARGRRRRRRHPPGTPARRG